MLKRNQGSRNKCRAQEEGEAAPPFECPEVKFAVFSNSNESTSGVVNGSVAVKSVDVLGTWTAIPVFEILARPDDDDTIDAKTGGVGLEIAAVVILADWGGGVGIDRRGVRVSLLWLLLPVE